MKKSTLLSALVLGSMALYGHSEPITTPTPGNKLLNVKVFLEGAYDGVSSTMKTTLKSSGVLPLAQPYTVAPWNYTGTESVTTIPADIVDWILVELRDAATPANAILGSNLPGWPKAFFLKSDGSIVDLDGTSLPTIGSPTITGNLYVVIRHRNHLPILSAIGATLVGDVYSYDFTTGLAQAFGGIASYKIVGSKTVMVAGDIYHDENIFVSDYNNWATAFGETNGYHNSDLDMDKNVFVSDYNKWATNFGSTTSIGIGGCKFTDSRDGNIYTCISIGTQTWMAGNLAWLPVVSPSTASSNTTPYYYVYGYEGSTVASAKATAHYTNYGVLYNWPAAMNGAASSTSVPSGVQGICPAGWHLPSDAEWTVLTDYLTSNGYGYGGSGSDIGKSMASPSGWTSFSTLGTVGNNQASNNRSGFTALPGGNRYSGGFISLGNYAYFWSASEAGTSHAWYRDLYYGLDGVDRYYSTRSFGVSVRCLQN